MSEDLDKRFYKFAVEVRDLCAIAGKEWINHEYVKQLLRSSSSVGANYIEASDSLGKADENMKLKIARREAKESVFWLQLLFIHTDRPLATDRNRLISECIQITKILSAILLKRS
ncbi:four helix bundle protein [Sediminibacterium goheungense]|uniref:Four helix bundle protein n=1 Tax=Sediminibacterium goheungense TaxID=1086393 RepID=A0A4R6IN29_9BACT|nr:four helix bundle protein [Sediminibacterium goheungense]TDO23619.1 four helix bundle protein [Sediminibacterium goheungense]